MDRLSPSDRSKNMAQVHGADTGPELAVRSALHRRGLRYALHSRDLPGCPDLVFRSAGVAVFVNGCFWHRHSCRNGAIPKSNRAFWAAKLAGNSRRDRRNLQTLRSMGWRTITIWECRIATRSGLSSACDRVEAAVVLGRAECEVPARY